MIKKKEKEKVGQTQPSRLITCVGGRLRTRPPSISSVGTLDCPRIPGVAPATSDPLEARQMHILKPDLS